MDDDRVVFEGPGGLALLTKLIVVKRSKLRSRRVYRLRSISGPIDSEAQAFGVNPDDSAALQKLRSAIDDLLVFPDAATEQDGDFLAAVQFSAQELSQLTQERNQLRRELASIRKLVEPHVADANTDLGSMVNDVVNQLVLHVHKEH